MGKNREWSIEEIKFLEDNYFELGATKCGDHLSRSKGSVWKKAKNLNLTFSGVKNKYRKEVLEPLIKDSKTISEVLEKLGMRCAGGNFKTIHKYIEEYGIDTNHFNEHEEKIIKLKERFERNKKPLSELLIENSNYNRGSLKKRLINENLLEYKCRKCDNIGEWMGEKLVLQLEHKNGVHNDNRLENLEFLCPNCHTQTKTYAGKKVKK